MQPVQWCKEWSRVAVVPRRARIHRVCRRGAWPPVLGLQGGREEARQMLQAEGENEDRGEQDAAGQHNLGVFNVDGGLPDERCVLGSWRVVAATK